MSLSEIVNVSITATSTSVTRQGFGTPLIAAYFPTSIFPERVRTYTSLAGLVSDGFTANHPVYKAATKILSQNPSVTRFKVGRRADPARPQIVRVIPTDTTQGIVQKVSVLSPLGVTVAVTYTNGAAETVATICAALQPLLDAVVGMTAVNATTHVTCTADVNTTLFDYHTLAGGLRVNDVTADGAIATELSAIETVDSDWYALILDNNSKAEIAATAAWIEARRKIFLANTADYEVLTDTAGNILETLNTAAYARTAVIYSGSIMSYAGAAWAGDRLPSDPGSSTWAYKTLAGVTVDTLTDTHRGNIDGNKGNHYTSVAGVNITRKGVTSSGEFIDVTIFIDWLTARLQERVYGLLVNSEKIPYTDPSVDKIRAEVLAQLGQGITAGGLAADPAPVVTAPRVADVAIADRQNRILPDVNFTATLAGAIHELQITGVLSV